MNTETDNVETRTSRAFERIVVEDDVAIARTALSRFENMYPSDDSFCSQAKKRHLKRDLLDTFIELEERGHSTYKYALEAVEIIRRCDKEIKEKRYLF
ncbi:hypothetical protein KY338_04795 [Candidatus Woesearchaeota archaeon]|nr:hypothetical protein [Candidatus Woesearchaeota archaeon]MBW3006224.1 hypothetical protein [Candidatus Woesearchaeota archaeon]